MSWVIRPVQTHEILAMSVDQCLKALPWQKDSLKLLNWVLFDVLCFQGFSNLITVAHWHKPIALIVIILIYVNLIYSTLSLMSANKSGMMFQTYCAIKP